MRVGRGLGSWMWYCRDSGGIERMRSEGWDLERKGWGFYT